VKKDHEFPQHRRDFAAIAEPASMALTACSVEI